MVFLFLKIITKSN